MTDDSFLYEVLAEQPGVEVAHSEILARSFRDRGCGLTVHSRASTLRGQGHNVICRTARVANGRIESYYRLIAPALATAAAPLPENEHAQGAAAVASADARPATNGDRPCGGTRVGTRPSEHDLGNEPSALTLFDLSAAQPDWA